MFLTALAFALSISIGAFYEVWAVWYAKQSGRDYTITNLIRTRTHLVIVLAAIYMLFGYALGRGAP